MKKTVMIAGAFTVVCAVIGVVWLAQRNGSPASPYVGEEARLIKSLSADDIASLQDGTGEAFGGMALPAELNGYPGPRHALDLADQLDLTPDQRAAIERMNSERAEEAVALGEKIIAIEKEIDDAFATGVITSELLKEKLEESAQLYGRLRFLHLNYHLDMVDILTPDQVVHYNELRGYAVAGDPCNNIPAGHDPDIWRQHNNCE